MKTKPEDLFLQEKPVRIMRALVEATEPMYIAGLAEAAESTYAHAFRVLEKLEILGLVKSSEQGRVRVVRLTDIGRMVASEILRMGHLLEIVSISSSIDEIYENEIKGKLREDIKKDAVLKKLDECIARLEEMIKKGPEELGQTAKKVMKRAEEIGLEVKGIVLD
ncbi:MAG: hypothetical protein QXG10_03020 [Candidatus Hadarchaeales archaeon]